MATPDPERQVQFLFDIQRLISDGNFVATQKFALLLTVALAGCLATPVSAGPAPG